MAASTHAGARRKTLADVASLARVDRSVVSRVFNDDPRLSIRPETRQRVIEAMKELDYRPNVMARSLRTSRAGTLGLLIPDFTNPIYAEIIRGAEEEAALAGSVLVTGSAQRGEDSTKAYLDLLGEGRVDGLLLANPPDGETSVALMSSTGLPWLFLNGMSASAKRYVALDDEKAARLAVSHLIELGHTRIAHAAGPIGADTTVRRRAGWEAALRNAGLPVDPTLVFDGAGTSESGVEALDSMLAMPVRPTAMFASTVESAIGVLHGASRRGLSVPDELSVVSVHDHVTAAYVVPGLTTVSMPLRKLGAQGVRRLLSTAAEVDVTDMIDTDIALVIRGTTAPPKD